jgi:hypothetical protein
MRFEYQTGPDGKRYASGGEVSIDTSEENTPEKTVKKMERVRAAAMAPKNPSPQDRRVASIASQRANLARQEISEQTAEEAAAMRENQPSRENESGDSGQAKRKSILNQSAEINRLIGLRQASKAYSEPEEYLMQPETRAAQPGNPASGDFGLVTTINPPEGSVADFASIGN